MLQLSLLEHICKPRQVRLKIAWVQLDSDQACESGITGTGRVVGGVNGDPVEPVLELKRR